MLVVLILKIKHLNKKEDNKELFKEYKGIQSQYMIEKGKSADKEDKKKAIKIKKHGRLSMSLFRYGLDYVLMAIQRLIGFGKKEEFKEILASLRKQNPDRIRVL